MKRLFKILAVLTALVLLVGSVPVSAAMANGPTTYYLKDHAASIKIMGRAEVTEQGLVPHTTASGFAFYSDCSGDIELSITGSSNIFHAQYFIVYVDGEIHNRISFEHGKGTQATETFKAASGLAAGMHRIEIYRETEEVNAQCVIHSITLNGTMTPVPEAPMMIEFIGDSITTGYGAYPVTAESQKLQIDHPIRQAGTKSYAFLTASALGMDFQACCTSGYGVQVGYNADDANLQKMYEYTAYHHDRNAKWGFERTADIVVINLGTNDSGASRSKGVKSATVLAGIKNMMQIARAKNPDAKIVWVTGMMGTVYKSGTEKIVEELGGAEQGYYFCVLPKGTSGGGGHPDESEHAAAAEVLIDFLKNNVLPADYASSFTTVEQAQELLDGGKLSAEYAAMLQTEINIAKATEKPYDGLLTGMYQTAQASLNVSQTPPADYTVVIIVAVAVGVVAVGGLIAFAVLYKPKKKESPPETVGEEHSETET